jgi:hypothetical protein
MGKMRLLFIDSYLSYRDDALKDRDKYLKSPLLFFKSEAKRKNNNNNIALIRIFIVQSNLSLRASSLYDK